MLLESSVNEEIPDFIDITEAELQVYWIPWTLWHLSEYKLSISELLDEPERPVEVFLEFENLHRILEKQKKRDGSN